MSKRRRISVFHVIKLISGGNETFFDVYIGSVQSYRKYNVLLYTWSQENEMKNKNENLKKRLFITFCIVYDTVVIWWNNIKPKKENGCKFV